MIDGIAGDLSDSSNLAGSSPPQSPFSNASIRIKFDGSIDPESLPADGAALGSIRVFQEGSQTPALGSWFIEGEHGDTAVFRPRGPTSTGSSCDLGIATDEVYIVEILSAAEAAPDAIVRLEGTPISQGATATFMTGPCTDAAPSFADSPLGAPNLFANTPPVLGADDPIVALEVLDDGFGQSRVIVEFDEALSPDSVNGATLALLHIPPALEVGLPITLESLIYSPGNDDIGRPHLILTTAERLRDGETFELRFFGVEDLSGNPLPSVVGLFRFATEESSVAMTSTFVEDFSDTIRREEVSDDRVIAWEGDGNVRARPVLQFESTGSLGAFVISESMTLNTEDIQVAGETISNGALDVTTFDLNPANVVGFQLNFTSGTPEPPSISRRPFRVRATESINIGAFTTIDAAGGPGTGSLVIGQSETVDVPGGPGGPGAGRGGRGSPINSGQLSLVGEDGFGAGVDPLNARRPGTADNNFDTSPFYGAGGAGSSGGVGFLFPSPSGGGGASSSVFDGSCGFPSGAPCTNPALQAGPGFAPAAPTITPIGHAGPNPAAFVIPLLSAVAGSGGGGGGDGTSSGSDEPSPGSGGGGGGGAIELSTFGDITCGSNVTWRVLGGSGGTSGNFGASGGGGSGGSLFLRALGLIQTGTGSVFDANGGGAILGGGNGGAGVIQMEDSDAASLSASFFTNNNQLTGELFIRSSGGESNTVSAFAISTPIDTGSRWSRYLAATAVVTNTGAGTASVFVRGLAEDPEKPNQPATTMVSEAGFPLMTDRVPLSDLSSLAGYRYFRFEVEFDYPAPPSVVLANDLPFVSEISVSYEN